MQRCCWLVTSSWKIRTRISSSSLRSSWKWITSQCWNSSQLIRWTIWGSLRRWGSVILFKWEWGNNRQGIWIQELWFSLLHKPLTTSVFQRKDLKSTLKTTRAAVHSAFETLESQSQSSTNIYETSEPKSSPAIITVPIQEQAPTGHLQPVTMEKPSSQAMRLTNTLPTSITELNSKPSTQSQIGTTWNFQTQKSTQSITDQPRSQPLLLTSLFPMRNQITRNSTICKNYPTRLACQY